jgi:Arc/MetJ family transcription regulator
MPNIRLETDLRIRLRGSRAVPAQPSRYFSDSLTCMRGSGMFMHMRTTLNIDDSLLRDAERLTGVKEKTSLVRLGLEALIAKESARRLASLGGTEKQLRVIRRRRSRSTA